MAHLGQTFDATQHDTEQRDYTNLPNGIYKLEIESSEVKATSDGQGQLLNVSPTVLEPEEFKGRKFFQRYNLVNKSSKAQEIGQRQFASLCRAVGVQQVEDSDELHFKEFTAQVGLTKPSSDGKYGPQNEIKRYYFPDEGNVPEPSISDEPVAANDNNKPAANDNQPAAAAKTGTSRPWGGGS